MKVSVFNIKGEKKTNLDLPKQFQGEIRLDVIKRGFLSEMSNSFQKKGVSETGGHKHSTLLSKRRRKYRGTYGRGRSRTPRKILSRRGTQFNYVGGFAPQTRGGRVSHPSKVEKIIVEKINDKERRLAIRSCLSASADKKFVEKRHKINNLSYPIVLSDDFNKLDKTKKIFEVLKKIGLTEELERSKKRKIRAGKGKMRGRKYKTRKGPLFVLDDKSSLKNIVRNIGGVTINNVNRLSLKELSPGGVPGRCLIFTESGLKTLEKGGLYL